MTIFIFLFICFLLLIIPMGEIGKKYESEIPKKALHLFADELEPSHSIINQIFSKHPDSTVRG